ncbi:MAG: CPXCG motif-containing cysteine-rich protein [Candidatus Sumerlaeaceae bacterium]
MIATAQFVCAYCGSVNVIEVDPSAGRQQEYEEDCQVCCNPNLLRIALWDDGRGADVDATREDGNA